MKALVTQTPRTSLHVKTWKTRLMISAALSVAALFLIATSALMAPQLTGAIFSTDSTCTGVDLNIYNNKSDVYLDGGPEHSNAAGLPDGYYYVQVTEPDGVLLGTSVGSANETPVHVTNGKFDYCYQLSAILINADGIPGCTAGAAGYCTTENPGGEYKVWVSTNSTFDNDDSKTDNFKVKENTTPQTGTLNVVKFYDSDANGVKGALEDAITGWEVRVGAQSTFDTIFETKTTPISIIFLAPVCYTAQEGDIADPSHTWVHTNSSIQSVTVPVPGSNEIDFGNVCLGAGGGLTLGFWSNKNGQALFNTNTGNVSVCGSTPASDLALVQTLNLRDGAGNNFDPSSYSYFRTWLLGASATNMAYMLSAQLAAMELNVLNGKVNGNAIIYAPGTGLSANGFATVCAVMNAANNQLSANGYTPSGNPNRAVQEALKNALDRANNDQNFVQSSAAQCGVANNTISNQAFTYPAAFTIPNCP
jgi:hypothetical protein